MKNKVSLHYLQKDMPWIKLSDLAHDHGAHGSRAIQAVIKVLTTPSFSDWKCQICNATVPKDYAVHVAESHPSMTIEEITDCLMLEEDKIEELFSVGRRLIDLWMLLP